MKGRKQKISRKETYRHNNRTESEGYVGEQTFMWITETNLMDNNQVGYGLLELILSPSNLNRAYKQVKRNKGSSGVDKMKVESLRGYLVENKDELIATILQGKKLRQYITGWVNYFKLADMRKLLLRIDTWYRRRLRMVIWKQWKRIKTKSANLTKLGAKKHKAWEWANTRKSYWHTSKSFILDTTITTEKLRQSGYIFLSDYYQKVRVKT